MPASFVSGSDSIGTEDPGLAPGSLVTCVRGAGAGRARKSLVPVLRYGTKSWTHKVIVLPEGERRNGLLVPSQ